MSFEVFWLAALAVGGGSGLVIICWATWDEHRRTRYAGRHRKARR